MEITNEERREVARKLRETKRECDQRETPWMAEDLMQALGFTSYEDGEENIFDRLADLIDRPTTTVTVTSGDDDSDLCIKCNSCCRGWHISKYDKSFTYCPECGAEVVE